MFKTGSKSLYETTEALLESKLEEQLFPVAKYKMYSILSIINHENGNLEKAKHYYNLGEKNANAETSVLQYHNLLGVVTERDSWLDKLSGLKS